MQRILDSGRSIIMSVDHGITRIMRDGFIRSFEIALAALLPKPYVILAVGDESNKVELPNFSLLNISLELE